MFKNLQEAKRFIQDNEIEFINLKIIDLSGRMRQVTVPSGKLDSYLMKNGVGFDGSNYHYLATEDSDMLCIPLLQSAFIDPADEYRPSLSFFTEIYLAGKKRTRYKHDPRHIMAKAFNYLTGVGFGNECLLGPEFEFYIFEGVEYINDKRGGRYTVIDVGSDIHGVNQSSSRPGRDGGYHVSPPGDRLYDIRNEIVECLMMANIPVKYHHHEVGSRGQVEIEPEFIPFTSAGDATVLAKYLIRLICHRNGFTACFLPKPLYGEAGNGMHIHFLMYKDKMPVFYDPDGYCKMSMEAMHFIGGLLTHAKSLCAFTNPTTNSYKRLVPGHEAPTAIVLGKGNRNAMIRIPTYVMEPKQVRFEFRPSDATCNPYFAYAALLMAGIDGMKKQIDPRDMGKGYFYDAAGDDKAHFESLPDTLEHALDALRQDHDYLLQGGVFNEELIEFWIHKKKICELEPISKMPSAIEYELYYDL